MTLLDGWCSCQYHYCVGTANEELLLLGTRQTCICHHVVSLSIFEQRENGSCETLVCGSFYNKLLLEEWGIVMLVGVHLPWMTPKACTTSNCSKLPGMTNTHPESRI
jgi:hypothetical protein